MVFAAVLAHQGGWDEAVLVALPLVVLVALLRMARRRALEETEREEQSTVDAPGPTVTEARRPPL